MPSNNNNNNNNDGKENEKKIRVRRETGKVDGGGINIIRTAFDINDRHNIIRIYRVAHAHGIYLFVLGGQALCNWEPVNLADIIILYPVMCRRICNLYIIYTHLLCGIGELRILRIHRGNMCKSTCTYYYYFFLLSERKRACSGFTLLY